MKSILSMLLLMLSFSNLNAADTTMAEKEAFMTKSLNLLDEVLTAIEGAKDDDSSKLAIKQIQTLMPKAQALKTESLKLGMDKLSEEDNALLLKKFSDRQEKIKERLFGALAILQKNPALLGEFQKVQAQLIK